MHKQGGMTTMKPTIILILALLSGAASADGIYFTLGGWSKHSDDDYEKCYNKIIGSGRYSFVSSLVECKNMKYNNAHDSVIIDYKGLTIGTYKNSYGNRTNLAGYTYRKGAFSATAAYGTGYRINNIAETCPVKLGKECALFSVGYTYKNVKASLMGQALVFSFEFKI
jgi:hypothetical protein